MPPTTWIFVRHGQSVANAEGWLSGWHDVALTDQGTQEAVRAGQQLSQQPIDRCLVSDLLRARQTFAAMLPFLQNPAIPVHITGDLRERRMGELTHARTALLKEDGRFARFLALWTTAPLGGESHQSSARRVVACLRHWDVGGTVLVVGHGGWMRDILALMEGIAPEEIGSRPPTANAAPLLTTARLPTCF